MLSHIMTNNQVRNASRTMRVAIVAAILNVGTVMAQTATIDDQTPWRVWTQQGGCLLRVNGVLTMSTGHWQGQFNPDATAWPLADGHRLSPRPPDGWQAADFDDSGWPQYLLGEIVGWIGGFGTHARAEERLWGVMARTRLGVTDPVKATDLKLEAEYLGGIIVYVNGKEVGRAHMRGANEQEQTWEAAGYRNPEQPRRSYPAPQSGIWAVARDYPREAYVLPDGEGLPAYRRNDARLQAPEILARYQTRVRRATIPIPADALVKGSNVLAIEIRHAPALSGVNYAHWSHAGLRNLRLVGGGAGVVTYADAVRQGPRVWSAEIGQTIMDQLPDPVRWANRGWLSKGDSGADVPPLEAFSSRAYVDLRTAPPVGIPQGNPFDPVRPIRILAPRNGVGGGQTVVTDPAGLKEMRATVSALKSASGATLPASAVEVRYLTAHKNAHILEALSPTPAKDAVTVPVWLRVRVSKEQEPGWYTGALAIAANGKSFQVPVQVMVTGYTVRAPREWKSDIGVSLSYENVAAHYNVPLWSEQHWARLEESIKLMGELGNDVMIAPVITQFSQSRFHSEPMIRFVKDGDRWKPDFSRFERYLDLHLKHAGPPKAVTLHIWAPGAGSRHARGNEGTQISSRENRRADNITMRVVDPATGQESEAPMIFIEDPGAEPFYKTLVGGARDLLVKHGISERALMLGTGDDTRPSQEDGERMRQWVPYARWNLLSHFSGDVGSMFFKGKDVSHPHVKAMVEERRYIAVGDLEIGLREDPFNVGVKPAKQIEELIRRPWQFVWLGTKRLSVSDFCAPTLLLASAMESTGDWGRIGLDYWDQRKEAPVYNLFYYQQINAVAAPGERGAIPTVRYEMIRLGMQAAEARRDMVAAVMDKPEAEKKAVWEFLDGLRAKRSWLFLPNADMALDWMGYLAEQYALAGRLTGQPDRGTWTEPPSRK